MTIRAAAALALLLFLPACTHTMPTSSPATTLDTLHAAAARADEPLYFSLFTDDAVFLGTDPAERWTLAEFRAYAHPHFAHGRGWAYTPSGRHIFLSSDERTAWFDETVTNAKYGPCRGTGVLTLTPAGWRIAQYNLSRPVPNELMESLLDLITGTR